MNVDLTLVGVIRPLMTLFLLSMQDETLLLLLLHYGLCRFTSSTKPAIQEPAEKNEAGQDTAVLEGSLGPGSSTAMPVHFWSRTCQVRYKCEL